jgi:hypothetical protein
LKRDAERFRALELNSTHGITLRPNGNHGMLLYIHGALREECEDASGGTLGECVDSYMRHSARAKRLIRAAMPTMNEEDRPSNFRHLRGKD